MYTLKKLDKSQTELTITVSPADCQKHLEKAAVRISERASIKGFRPGKAPYETVKKEVGEMNILNEALETIIQEAFFNAVVSEKLDTVGMPKIDIEKLAPGNDVVFRATVALLPAVKLANIKKISVKKEIKPITEKDVEETLNALRGMHAKDVLKTGIAEKTDKLVIDMDMYLDKVPVEGGQAHDYHVYLSEQHYIPGFNEQLVGLKKDEAKEFSLDFPPTHYQKHLAGKKVDFKVKIKDIFERQLPELDDELAKKLGQEGLAKLKELINSNITAEHEQKAEQKAEIEILDKLIDGSTFGGSTALITGIPDVLIDAEKQKMFYELKHNLEHQGITIEQYLEQIKKKQDEVMEGFGAQAEKRAKAALVSRQVAKEQNIVVSDEEIGKEIKVMEDIYKDNKDYLERLKRPEVRDTIAMSLQNKKVMEWLKSAIMSPYDK
ncbi:trigger factor [Candidatus Falkowbacteria bacterium]|nr:trigger factor [Candidatus Falkowbacteria bacterium]